jgi:[ribosomal protein S5]-alanine N-acetyltransferase
MTAIHAPHARTETAAKAAVAAVKLPATLATQRLRLRPFIIEDAPRLAMFVGDYDVAKMTATIPHPYSEADARHFITASLGAPLYAIVHANGVIGAVSLQNNGPQNFEIGYWLAKPFWGRGIMTEAARSVIIASRHSCSTLRITAAHCDDNPASGRVLVKLGFEPTGEKTGHSLARGAAVRLLTYSLPISPTPH